MMRMFDIQSTQNHEKFLTNPRTDIKIPQTRFANETDGDVKSKNCSLH